MAGKPPQQTGSEYLNKIFSLTLVGEGRPQTFARPFSREPWTGVWVSRVGRRPGEDEAIRRGTKMPTTGRSPIWFYFWIRGVVFVNNSGSIIFPNSPAGGYIPAVPTTGRRDFVETLKKEMDTRFNAARGRLILSRNTDVNYMAMGSQP